MYELAQSLKDIIEEREYKVNVNEIKFGKFTSCIGIISLNCNSTISAIHLSMIDGNNNTLDDGGISQIVSLLSDDVCVYVIGFIDLWEDNVKNLRKFDK